MSFIHDDRMYNIPLSQAGDNFYYDFNNTVVADNGYSVTLVPTSFAKSKDWANPVLNVYYKTDSSKTSIVNSFGSYYILHEMPKLSKKDAEELAIDFFYGIASYEYPREVNLEYLPKYVADEIEQVCYGESDVQLSLSVGESRAEWLDEGYLVTQLAIGSWKDLGDKYKTLLYQGAEFRDSSYYIDEAVGLQYYRRGNTAIYIIKNNMNSCYILVCVGDEAKSKGYNYAASLYN